MRAHHLICMRSFQGNGYSANFVDNFQKVISKINGENPVIKIVNCPDVICKACPHNKNGCIKKGPKSEVKVRNKDNNFISLLKLDLNNEMKANELINLINERITNIEIKDICKECEWLKYCLEN